MAPLIAEESSLIQQRRQAQPGGPVLWRPRRVEGAALIANVAGTLEGLDDAGQPVMAEAGRPGLRLQTPGVPALLAQLEALAAMRHPHIERVLGWGYSDGGNGSGEPRGVALLTEPHVCGSAADLFERLAAPECRRAQQTSARRCPCPPRPSSLTCRCRPLRRRRSCGFTGNLQGGRRLGCQHRCRPPCPQKASFALALHPNPSPRTARRPRSWRQGSRESASACKE